MVAFFDSIDAIVTVAVETQVDPFLAQLDAVTSAALTLGGYTIAEFTSTVSVPTLSWLIWTVLETSDSSQLLYNSMLNIRCYFTLFKDLAKLYMEIHLKYLVGGLELLGEMQIEDADGPNADKRLKAKQLKLNNYTNTTLPKIKNDIVEVSVGFGSSHFPFSLCFYVQRIPD
jgi:hypothetical protein